MVSRVRTIRSWDLGGEEGKRVWRREIVAINCFATVAVKMCLEMEEEMDGAEMYFKRRTLAS